MCIWVELGLKPEPLGELEVSGELEPQAAVTVAVASAAVAAARSERGLLIAVVLRPRGITLVTAVS